MVIVSGIVIFTNNCIFALEIIVVKKNRKILNVILHVSLWIIVLMWPLSSVISRENFSQQLLQWSLTVLPLLIICFYLNYYILIPKLFFKKKYAIYGLILIGIFTSVVFTNLVFHNQNKKNKRIENVERDRMQHPPQERSQTMHPPPSDNQPPPRREDQEKNIPPFLFSPIFTPLALLLLFIFGLAARLTIRWVEQDRQNQAIREEQLNTELAFLKNQISPHFFFNTLNNIYALIGSDAEKAQEVTYKLSKLMRYLLYESEKGRNVTLGMEIAFASNYIDLMKIRLTDNIEISTDFGSEKDRTSIPALLFIPFIENAFKHGVSANDNCKIQISLKKCEDKVIFSCINSIPKNNRTIKEEGGLGLSNTERRLDILFGEDKYSLKINDTDKLFDVELIIPTNEN